MRLFLIDGTALAYRSHFAFAPGSRGGLSTKAGQPTGAVYGFTMSLRAILDGEKPDAVVVSFDGPRGELERMRIYPEYKSTRDKMPDELVSQLALIERVTRAHGLPIVRSKGHEADDVIGTLALRGKKAGYEVMIVTGDKDFLQLVDDKIKLWNPRTSTRTPEILGPTECKAQWGVEPARMTDLLALMGDTSDNVPGVPGVGEKTAIELMQHFGTLEEALAHPERAKRPSIQKSLAANRDQALLSRRLVTIQTDVPVDCDIETLRRPEPDVEALRALFKELEFDSLLAGLPQATADAGPQDYRIVADAKALDALLAELARQERFAVAIETTRPDPLTAEIVGMAFCAQDGLAHYVPFRAGPAVLGGAKTQLPGGKAELLARLRPLLEDPALEKIGANTKYDRSVLRTAGIEACGYAFDTTLASYCLSPGIGQHGLDALAVRYYGYKRAPLAELVGTGKKQIGFDQVPLEQAARYSCEAADFTWRVHAKLAPELERKQIAPLLSELEMPLVGVLIDMEREGIALDVAHLSRLSADWQQRLERIEKRIYERAGEPFNLNSPQQIGVVLFEKLEAHKAAGITKPKRTPTGQYKTDADVLEKLAKHHEVAQLLIEYRQLSKLKGTYVDALPAMVHPKTGRVHTTFNQAVAATGRLSSDDPNLQNIPIRTVEGREVRRAFVARDRDWVLVSADYSQIELRIVAHMSGDPALRDAFRKNEDIHTRTAALVHGLLPGTVSPALRNQAKIVNYGLIYGMGPSRLAQETGMTPPEAKRFIEAYFKALPKVKAFLDGTLEKARATGGVWTMFGRYRPLPDVNSDDPMRRSQAENMAVNTPIQGTAADIVKRAMLRLAASLAKGKLRTRLLLQVHDELVLEAPKAELSVVEALLRDAMEGAADLTVPLSISIGHGANWLEAH